MSQIHLNRAGQNLGTFSLEQVQQGLDAGRFVESDLGWQHGMENWKPLSTWPELTLPVETATTATTTATISPPVLPGELLQNLPSWEQREQIGYLKALGLTIKETLIQPEQTFARMQPDGGLLAPLFYFVLTGFIGGVFALGYEILINGGPATSDPKLQQAFGQIFHMPFPTQPEMSTSYLIGMIVGALIGGPLMLAVASFIFGAITHLCLLMLGGANKSFEATYRVCCYAGGSGRILGVLPVCGTLVGMLWGMVSTAIGLAKVHETETWRTVLAILLPILVCCGALVLLAIMFFSAIAAMVGHHS